MSRYTTLAYWLPKIPLLSLVGVFVLPLILMEVNYKLGLFFIAFYIAYWSVKVFESYYYVLRSYMRLLSLEKRDLSRDPVIVKWGAKFQHIVIVPIYTEPYDVIEENILSLLATEYPYRENITVLLATEARAPDAETHAQNIIKNHGSKGINIVNIVHPADLPNEGKVKGSNITYAIKTYESMRKEEWVALDPEHTFVSTIDTDTKVRPDFFSIVSYTFLSTDYRHHAIYQYAPVYSNNWRTGHFFARIIGIGTTMWQLFESQNPEFYRNFAVYGQSLTCLHKADYWDKFSIVEDGMQYWRSYFGWGGFFRIVNTPAICEMDLVAETNIYRTVRSQYKQLRRWSWGCTDVEYVIPQFVASRTIPTREKIRKTLYLIYNHLFWAGGPFMLFFIGYVPGIFYSIDHSLAAFTVPIASSIVFTILFATVVFPSLISIHIMRRYTNFTAKDYVLNLIQWIAVPVLTLTLFSIPAIESQIRLFFGKRIDSFDTTQKMNRK
jgi:cellulose synthase/poly-beta-1,6-N-acetylglucosamine synthase-like glycosyltransferase